jgi:hypothetical protein
VDGNLFFLNEQVGYNLLRALVLSAIGVAE